MTQPVPTLPASGFGRVPRALVASVCCTGLAQLGLMAAHVLLYGGDVSCLVCANKERIGEPPFEVVRTGFAPIGYDGQYYYTRPQPLAAPRG